MIKKHKETKSIIPNETDNNTVIAWMEQDKYSTGVAEVVVGYL